MSYLLMVLCETNQQKSKNLTLYHVVNNNFYNIDQITVALHSWQLILNIQ